METNVGMDEGLREACILEKIKMETEWRHVIGKRKTNNPKTRTQILQ